MGGGSGIGNATAELFAAAGANLMITGVPEDICLTTAEELRADGANAVGMVCDDTKADQVQAVIDKTVAEFGGIDILVSTAGIALPRMNSIEVTEADWDKIFAVNLKANFFLCTAAARVMKDNPDGGKLALGMVEAKFWEPFCDAIGHPEIKPTGLMREWEAPEAFETVRQVIAGKTTQEWLDWLEEDRAPVAPR